MLHALTTISVFQMNLLNTTNFVAQCMRARYRTPTQNHGNVCNTVTVWIYEKRVMHVH